MNLFIFYILTIFCKYILFFMSFENYLIENSFKTNLLPNKKAALHAAFYFNPRKLFS